MNISGIDDEQYTSTRICKSGLFSNFIKTGHMRTIGTIMICVLFWGCQSQQTRNKETTEQDQTISFPLPDGFMGRGIENAYVVYSDSVEQHNGHHVSTIKAINPVKFATILSYLKPEKCIGQRIKYTAWVRSKDVANWAGLWLRIDPANPSSHCLMATGRYG